MAENAKNETNPYQWKTYILSWKWLKKFAMARFVWLSRTDMSSRVINMKRSGLN